MDFLKKGVDLFYEKLLRVDDYLDSKDTREGRKKSKPKKKGN